MENLLILFTAVIIFLGSALTQIYYLKESCSKGYAAIIQASNQVDKANAYYYDCMEEERK